MDAVQLEGAAEAVVVPMVILASMKGHQQWHAVQSTMLPSAAPW
jgi:hypothetical protein